MAVTIIPGTSVPDPRPSLGRIPIWLPPIRRGLVGSYLPIASAAQARHNYADNSNGVVLGAPRYEAGFIAGDDSGGDANAGAINTGITQTRAFTWISMVKSLDTGAGATTRPQWISNRLTGADSLGARIQEATESASRTIQLVAATTAGTSTASLDAVDPTVWRCIAVRVDDSDNTFRIYSLSLDGTAAQIDAQASANISGLTIDPAASTLRLLNNANSPANAGKGAISVTSLHSLALTEAEMLVNAAIVMRAAAGLGVTVGA